jgi:AraC-like DNA-binding protein
MVRVLMDECGRRGIEPDVLLAQSPLIGEQLSKLGGRVPSAVFEGLAVRALELTGDDSLGLALGARMPTQALQVIGYLLASAPTMRHAYRDFERYALVLAEGPSWAMREHGDRAQFEFTCAIPNPATLRVANDWAASLAYRIIKSWAPESAGSAIGVALSHPRPSAAEAYRALFEGPVQFGQRQCAVTFPRAWLDLPQLHGDARTCDGLREMAEQLLSSVSSQRRLVDRVRVILHEERRLSNVNVALLARKLGLSQSALRRRLATEGASPSQLVADARRERACAELGRLDASIKQVAAVLGYAQLRSFNPAFKRWTGRTPAEYRRMPAGAPGGASATAD